MFYRVFGLTADPVATGELNGALLAAGLTHQAAYRGEGPDRGDWHTVALTLPGASPVTVERYRTDEDELRGELNTWAAWLETADWSPHAPRLMERMIAVRQLFAWRRPVDHADEVHLDRLCLALARFLAGRTGGFYQVDEQGFFSADGELLVPEY
jgi:hypothetical protein